MWKPTFRLPSWLSWYKKPEYRDIKEYARTINEGKRPMSPDGRRSAVPPRLRLDRILANKTCSPMSLYDFYMYLKYIEFSAENLEFYMWFKNYEASYAKGLTGLSALGDKDYGSMSSSTTTIKQVEDAAITPIEDKDDDDYEDPEIGRQAMARISQLISVDALCSSKGCTLPVLTPGSLERLSAEAKAARPTVDLQLLSPPGPVSRRELQTVVSLFLMPGSEKELNIPPALRQQCLSDLEGSTHPEALKPVADHVYGLLRNCSHRNFVRLGVGNGTFETICVATVLGIANLVAGFIVVLCRALVPGRGTHTRWEAFAAWPLWWLGLSLVLSGLRGSCFFLLLFSRRQPLPWERFDDDKGAEANGAAAVDRKIEEDEEATGWRRVWKVLSRLMIFDRRLKVKEKHLRRLQRKIVMQSLVGGSVFATALVMLFILLPIWKETVSVTGRGRGPFF